MRRWSRWLGHEGSNHQEGGVCQVLDGRFRESLAKAVREADRHWDHLGRCTARPGTMDSYGHDSKQLGESGAPADCLNHHFLCPVVQGEVAAREAAFAERRVRIEDRLATFG